MPQAQTSLKTLDANDQLLARKGWLVGSWAGFAPAGAGFGPSEYEALTIGANLESFGARATPESLRILSWQDAKTLEAAYGRVERAARTATGSQRDFQPMYPGFPLQVAQASDALLMREALAHYGSVALGGRALPERSESGRDLDASDERSAEPQMVFEVIEPARALEFVGALARSNAAMAPADREALGSVAHALAADGLGAQASAALCGGPNKENMAACAAVAFELGQLPAFCESLTVCTDALRVACAVSGGDPSLAEKTKFKSMARPVRRALMGVVERHFAQGDGDQALENMFARRETWLRLGERLHPGELSKAFPMASIAFDDLRQGREPVPFARKVAEALAGKNVAEAIKLLSSRPGEFARKAAAASRALGKESHGALAKAFGSRAGSVSTPVLLQALCAFETAVADPSAHRSRAFLPKGGMGKVYLREDERELADAKALDPAFALAMAQACERALLERFARFEPLGAVWVDPALDKINAPFAARAASRQTKTLARGSRVAIDAPIARLFVWWSERGVDKDGNKVKSDRVDIDLSSQFLDKDFRPCGHVSWTSLRESGVVHSGDITSAPNGACEFIDIDCSKLAPNVKYIAATVHCYTGQSFDEMPECFVGWMGRDGPMKGRVFDARCVESKSDLAIPVRDSMPLFFDVDAREAVWADLAMPSRSGYAMVERQAKAISMTLKALATLRKPTMGRLARLHAQARGHLVAAPEQADVVFGLTQGFMPYDFELVASEMLADEPPAKARLKKPAPAPSPAPKPI